MIVRNPENGESFAPVNGNYPISIRDADELLVGIDQDPLVPLQLNR